VDKNSFYDVTSDYFVPVLFACILLGLAIAGIIGLYQWNTTVNTGPCAGKGGPSYNTQQDYLYCNNGERVILKSANDNTATYTIKSQ
jgi:hypothetical protein